MRMPVSQERGNQGVAAVSSKFEKLGWGPVPNSPQDLGIDLFVHARVERYDRGLVVGVQVKSGKSSFKEPKRGDDGEIVGWWYRDRDRKHSDYWVMHGLPILLVLHDLEHGESYWVHVVQQAVVSTGKGAKILVPRDQTIEESNIDALFAAAAQMKAVPPFEGSTLAFGTNRVPPERHWRYALVAPRLIVPDPYKHSEGSIEAAEAAALLAMGRFRDLKQLAEAHDDVPDPECVPSEAGWGWQFVGAIWDWATTGSLDGLVSVHQNSPDFRGATASGVLLACGLLRQERHTEATAVLDSLARCDAMNAVDRGWTLVQRARIHTDRGDFAAAQSDATDAQRTFFGDADDPTVSALKTSAAWVLYIVADAMRYEPEPCAPESEAEFEKAQRERETAQQEAFRDLLAASDTTVSWWRSQHIARGLSREQDSSFESWAEHGSPTYLSGGQTPETELFAAEFNADMTGEHRTWRALSARRAQQTLMSAASSPDETDRLGEGLDALRRSGDSRRLTQAVKRLVSAGPLKPLVAAMNNIPISGWTRTTALANFETLALAGDLVEQAAADELLEGCARAACGDTTDLGCTTGDGYISVPHYGTLAAATLLSAASDVMHTHLAGHLARLSDLSPAFVGHGLEQALNWLDYAHVSPEDRASLRGLAERGDAQLSAAVHGWFESNNDSDSLDALKQAALRGDMDALSAINNVTAFDAHEAAALIAILDQHVQQAHSEALAGTLNSGSRRSFYGLARCNLLFPDAARWQAVVDVFGEPKICIEDKRAICDAIAPLPERLPAETRSQLASLVDFAAANSRSFFPGSEAGGMAIRLKIALGLMDGNGIDAAVTKLVFGSRLERCDASAVLRTADCANRGLLLNVLAHDTDFAVRYHAANAVGYLDAGGTNDAIGALAWELARSDGRQIPVALIDGISAAAARLGGVTSAIPEFLAEHPSAAIRIRAKRL